MGHKLYILSEDGEQPIWCPDLFKWGEWYEQIDKRRIVKQETIGDKWISTVFLGIDHGWGDVPIVWETMVFENNKDVEMDRCAGNREQALAMHEAMVERVKALVAL